MAKKQRTEVFLVEDSPAIRLRLAELINSAPDVEVVGEADSPASAIQGIDKTHPDLVVLDIRLSGGAGMEVLRCIKPRHPEIVFVVMTNHPEPHYRDAYLRAGASYFLDKSSEFGKVTEIIAGLDVATCGQSPIGLLTPGAIL